MADIKKDEEKKRLRVKMIEKAKKKTEAESRPLFVGYFLDDLKKPDEFDLPDLEKVTEESKIQEKQRSSGGDKPYGNELSKKEKALIA